MSVEDYQDWTIQKLRIECKDRGIKKWATLDKDGLIGLLDDYDKAKNSEAPDEEITIADEEELIPVDEAEEQPVVEETAEESAVEVEDADEAIVIDDSDKDELVVTDPGEGAPVAETAAETELEPESQNTETQTEKDQQVQVAEAATKPVKKRGRPAGSGKKAKKKAKKQAAKMEVISEKVAEPIVEKLLPPDPKEKIPLDIDAETPKFTQTEIHQIPKGDLLKLIDRIEINIYIAK